MGLLDKNTASKDSPKTSDVWKKMSKDERILALKKIIHSVSENFKDFEIVNASDNGYVFIKTEKKFKTSERGVMLIDLEKKIKSIDEGLTLWLEPVGDKSKLRNLRGITFKSV